MSLKKAGSVLVALDFLDSHASPSARTSMMEKLILDLELCDQGQAGLIRQMWGYPECAAYTK